MKIPITLNYNQKKVIGEATIDENDEDIKKILESARFTFRAGFILEGKPREERLKEISLVTLPERYGYPEDEENEKKDNDTQEQV